MGSVVCKWVVMMAFSLFASRNLLARYCHNLDSAASATTEGPEVAKAKKRKPNDETSNIDVSKLSGEETVVLAKEILQKARSATYDVKIRVLKALLIDYLRLWPRINGTKTADEDLLNFLQEPIDIVPHLKNLKTYKLTLGAVSFSSSIPEVVYVRYNFFRTIMTSNSFFVTSQFQELVEINSALPVMIYPRTGRTSEQLAALYREIDEIAVFWIRKSFLDSHRRSNFKLFAEGLVAQVLALKDWALLRHIFQHNWWSQFGIAQNVILSKVQEVFFSASANEVKLLLKDTNFMTLLSFSFPDHASKAQLASDFISAKNFEGLAQALKSRFLPWSFFLGNSTYQSQIMSTWESSKDIPHGPSGTTQFEALRWLVGEIQRRSHTE